MSQDPNLSYDYMLGSEKDSPLEQTRIMMDELTRLQVNLNQIAYLHRKYVGVGGMTDGSCEECANSWPCETYHLAQDWEDYHQCEEDHWCKHIEDKM